MASEKYLDGLAVEVPVLDGFGGCPERVEVVRLLDPTSVEVRIWFDLFVGRVFDVTAS
jgi:hypothetical protein